MGLTAVLTPDEEGGYIALNPEPGTTTQCETVEEASANLQEATALYLSEFPLPPSRHPLATIFRVPAHILSYLAYQGLELHELLNALILKKCVKIREPRDHAPGRHGLRCSSAQRGQSLHSGWSPVPRW